jgi:hypothetical protein
MTAFALRAGSPPCTAAYSSVVSSLQLGRTAAQKSGRGLLKLLYPNALKAVADEKTSIGLCASRLSADDG